MPTFSGSTAFTVEVPCTYDLEVASARVLRLAARRRACRSAFHFNGTVLYRGEADRLQVVLVPWSCSARWRMPSSVWRRTIEGHYPGGGWIRLAEDTLEQLSARKADAGHGTRSTTTVRGLLGGGD